MPTYPLHLRPLIKSFLEKTIKGKSCYAVQLYMQIETVQTMLLLSLFPLHRGSSLSNCLQAILVPANLLNQHATEPAQCACIFTWGLTGRKKPY